jgi:1,4-alpha-glucan branching enzyme
MKNSKFSREKSTARENPSANPYQSKSTETAVKTAETYGVRQMRDEVVFAAFYPGARTVQVAGDFNNWHPERNPMQKIDQNSVWQLKLRLSPGIYHYRLVIDGTWQQDPHNNNSEPNPYGGFNSILKVI